MRHKSRLAAVAALMVSVLFAETASAQRYYPGYYRGYGYSRWGADPGAGYIAAMGSYGRSQGQYDIDEAKARSIERDSLIKWNQALAVQRRQTRQEKAVEDAKKAAVDAAKDRQAAINSGATLNDLLEQILELNPSGVRSVAARTPVTIAAVKDIAFEPATEPISICLDQLTGEDALPFVLKRPEFAERRAALRAAVVKAFQEDAKGSVSEATMTGLNHAVAAFRDQFHKAIADTDPGYLEADEFLRTVGGLSRLLHNPQFQKAIAELGKFKEGTLADLIVFMQAFNLRFGPAASDRQITLYSTLAPELARVLVDSQGGAPAPADTRSKNGLGGAARGVFSGVTWGDLATQSKGDQ